MRVIFREIHILLKRYISGMKKTNSRWLSYN